MSIRPYATTFFVNGHECTIEHASREHYRGFVEGEEIATGPSPKRIKEELVNDAKWRTAVERDYWEIVAATHAYMKQHDGWVHINAIRDEIQPAKDFGGNTYSALLELESFGILENGGVYMSGIQPDDMWRVVSDKDVDYEEECVPPFSKYK